MPFPLYKNKKKGIITQFHTLIPYKWQQKFEIEGTLEDLWQQIF